MKPIHELLNPQQVHCVGKDRSVMEVARRMTEWNVGAVGILDGERLVGIFSERDLMNAWAAGASRRRTPASSRS